MRDPNLTPLQFEDLAGRFFPHENRLPLPRGSETEWTVGNQEVIPLVTLSYTPFR